MLLVTFPHDTHPLSFKAAFCVIDIPEYRLLLGRDLLVPLKFEASAAGLRLTDPKSGVCTLFPYHAAPAYLCSVSDPFLGATFTDSWLPPSLQGDILPSFSDISPPFSLFSPNCTPTSANVCDHVVVSPTKGDVFPSFPAVSATKGDVFTSFPAVSATKGDVFTSSPALDSSCPSLLFCSRSGSMSTCSVCAKSY